MYALYPESNQRTLEEMDFLFAAPTPWAWDAEKTFARLKEEATQERGETFKHKSPLSGPVELAEGV